MKLNYHPYYEKQYWYTLGEAFKKIFEDNEITSTAPYVFIDETFPTILIDPENYDLFNIVTNFNSYIYYVLELVFNRFEDEYIFSLEHEYNYEELYESEDGNKAIMKFYVRLLDLLIMTYSKYSILLELYDNQKTNLLNKLKRTSSTEGSSSGTNSRRDNDTPQDSGTFTDNTHTSFYTAGSDSSEMESGTTEEWDSEPIIDRLARIEEKMSNLMLKWTDEFKILFVEGGNIHEIG